MLWRLLCADLRRSRAVSFTLAVLIALSALLGCTSAGLMARTYVALDRFWTQSKPADFVQMHTGPLDEARVSAWLEAREDVADYHVMRTLPVPGAQLFIAGRAQSDSVLEPALVTSPERFDLLLDAHGRRVDPAAGEVWLPVHYQAANLAAIGDQVTIKLPDGDLQLRVAGFARDAEMNPSLVTSKRLVVNGSDFARAAKYLDSEYLIEVKVAEGASSASLQDAYATAGHPAQGMAVDSTIFKLLNALSVLVLAATLVVVALVLIVVAVVALRFAFLAAIEQDLGEIATLRIIGLPLPHLKRLYLTKYAVLATVGSLVGLVASWPAVHLTSAQIELYLGQPTGHPLLWWSPIAAAALTAMVVIASCWHLLGRLSKLSAVEIVRTGTAASTRLRRPRWRLTQSRLSVPTFLGLQGAAQPANALLVIVVALCAFVMIVPANVAATFDDPRFASYLGVGQADIRLDLRSGTTDAAALERAVAADPRVQRSTSLLSGRFKVKNRDGLWEPLIIETGDHEVFPLRYETGRAPQTTSDIALSVNEATALGVVVGDTLEVALTDRPTRLTVSGTYQDITNGGKTGKARFALPGAPLWQVIYLDVADSTNQSALIDELTRTYPDIKVTDADQYTAEAMGSTITQMAVLAQVTTVSSTVVAMVIFALFVMLVLARNRGEITMLRTLGADLRMMRQQYLIHFGAVTAVGLALGAVLAATAGQQLFAWAMGSLGAPSVVFLPRAWLSWVALPLLLAIACLVAVQLGLRRLTNIQIEKPE